MRNSVLRSLQFTRRNSNCTLGFITSIVSSINRGFVCEILKEESSIMNCEVCQLKELDVEHFEIREVLRCILHTIMFHRALGLLWPKDVDLELFDITYTQCGDVEVEKKIEEKITQFIDRVEKHPNRKNQICLSFCEVKNKQASWFTTKVERFYWEHWYINLNVAHHPKGHSVKSYLSKVVDPGVSASEERSVRHTQLESSLREVMFQIIKFVNEKKDHIPAIPNLECVTFPYEITISRFCFWDGCDQEDATDWASDHAQLIGDALVVANLPLSHSLIGKMVVHPMSGYVNILDQSLVWVPSSGEGVSQLKEMEAVYIFA